MVILSIECMEEVIYYLLHAPNGKYCHNISNICVYNASHNYGSIVR